MIETYSTLRLIWRKDTMPEPTGSASITEPKYGNQSARGFWKNTSVNDCPWYRRTRGLLAKPHTEDDGPDCISAPSWSWTSRHALIEYNSNGSSRVFTPMCIFTDVLEYLVASLINEQPLEPTISGIVTLSIESNVEFGYCIRWKYSP